MCSNRAATRVNLLNCWEKCQRTNTFILQQFFIVQKPPANHYTAFTRQRSLVRNQHRPLHKSRDLQAKHKSEVKTLGSSRRPCAATRVDLLKYWERRQDKTSDVSSNYLTASTRQWALASSKHRPLSEFLQKAGKCKRSFIGSRAMCRASLAPGCN